MTEPEGEMDPRKVRMGLLVVVAVVVVAVVLIAMIDDPFGRAIMVAVAGLAVVRAFLLSRELRK